MRVIADASPLIFLAKIRQVDLMMKLWGRDILVPRRVADEVLAAGTDYLELDVLKGFLQHCKIETIRSPRQFALAMSLADNEALTLAIRSGASMLLCDDKLTRRMAELEGVRPIGTLGILLQAMQQDLISPHTARTLIDQLVEHHAFRIGISVYQAALHAINNAS
jgi:predicted nucleic acid-binding protein